MAAELAIKAFTRTKKPKNLHLQKDNTVALSCILKMGSTKNEILTKYAKRIWEYLLREEIMITVEYLPGALNKIADAESRKGVDRSEWKLNPLIFREICKQFQFQPLIDLFASRHSYQLTPFMSWKADPYTLAVDAMQQRWAQRKPYAFPPFSLGRVLKKVNQEEVSMLLIAPTWQTQKCASESHFYSQGREKS